MLLEGENINLHGTPLNRLSPANQSRSRHGPSHLSVQGTRRRLLSAWAGATISVPGNSSRRKRRRETERRKIMYNTNKVSLSPRTPFIPNQFLVKEPNPEGLSARGRCTGEKAGYKMRSSKQRQKPSSAYQSLGKAHAQHLCSWQLHRSQSAPSRAGVPLLWSWGGPWQWQHCWGHQRRAQGSSISQHWVEMPSLCMQTALAWGWFGFFSFFP